MDTELHKKLDRIIELLEEIKTGTDEIYYTKSAVDDVETVAKKILKHLKENSDE